MPRTPSNLQQPNYIFILEYLQLALKRCSTGAPSESVVVIAVPVAVVGGVGGVAVVLVIIMIWRKRRKSSGEEEWVGI